MEENKEFVISLLILTFVILATLAILFSAFLRTCEEDYNPCNKCMEKTGYMCVNPYQNMDVRGGISNLSYQYNTSNGVVE